MGKPNSKTYKPNPNDRSIVSNGTSVADYYRSVQSTPLKMSSPSNRSYKPRGDVINLSSANLKSKTAQVKPKTSTVQKPSTSFSAAKSNLQTQSLRSILEQTRKFIP